MTAAVLVALIVGLVLGSLGGFVIAALCMAAGGNDAPRQLPDRTAVPTYRSGGRLPVAH